MVFANGYQVSLNAIRRPKEALAESLGMNSRNRPIADLQPVHRQHMPYPGGHPRLTPIEHAPTAGHWPPTGTATELAAKEKNNEFDLNQDFGDMNAREVRLRDQRQSWRPEHPHRPIHT